MDPAAAVSRAENLLDLGRPEEAARVASTALAGEPDDIGLLLVLGRAQQRLERPREVLEVVNRAVALDPEHPDAHLLAAEALLDLGASDDALRAAVESARLAPWAWPTHYTVARASLAPGRHRSLDQAERAAREALRLAPHEASTHDVLGIVLGERGRSKEAMAAHRQALALEPDHTHAMRNLSAEALSRGRLGSAGRTLRQALSLAPTERILHELLDAYLVLLMRRLLWVWLIIGIALFGLVESGADRWVRAGVGAILVLVGTAVVLRVARHLPGHRARWFLGMIPRLDWAGRLILVLVLLMGVALGFLAFAPEGAAVGAAIVVAIVFRILIWGAVFAVVRAVARRLRR